MSQVGLGNLLSLWVRISKEGKAEEKFFSLPFKFWKKSSLKSEICEESSRKIKEKSSWKLGSAFFRPTYQSRALVSMHFVKNIVES